MTHETRRTIAPDHPSLPGHFPGAPIGPAVVILDEVATALNEWQSNARIIGFPMVKFTAVIRPDQPFTIVLSSDGVADNELNFSCAIDAQTAVRGRLLFGSQPTSQHERSTV